MNTFFTKYLKKARHIVLCIAFFSAQIAFATIGFDEQNLTFENFTPEEGISQSSVTSLLQDSKGFIWIGSGDGLNRYDGKTFTVLYAQKDDSTSLSNNSIWELFEDSEGYIWIGTQFGLNRFDWGTETFRRFLSDPGDSTTLSNNSIWSFEEDKDGNIWIGTYNGLNCYNKATDSFTRYLFEGKIGKRKPRNSNVLSLYYDDRDILWVGTYRGLLRFDIRTKSWKTFYPDPKDMLNSRSNIIFSIVSDSSGTLWLGTGDGLFKMTGENKIVRHLFQNFKLNHVPLFDLVVTPENKIWIGSYGEGLIFLDPANGTVYQWKNDPYRKNSLIYDHIFELILDRSGILWIATGSGLSKADLQSKRFHSLAHYPNCDNCLSDNIVWSVFQDSRGEIWIGTDRGGLNRYNPKTKKFKAYLPDPKNPNSLSGKTIMSIREDQQGKLWIAVLGGGLNVFDPQTEKFEVYRHNDDDSNSISSDYLQSIYIDKKNNIWIGTQEGILNHFDRDNKKFVHYAIAAGNISNMARSLIWCITEDKNGDLLISSDLLGLIRLHPDTKEFEYLSNSPGLKELQIHSIMSIYPEKNSDVIWLGTGGYGLIKYVSDQGKAYLFDRKSGLPNEMIYGVLPEEDKDTGELRALWLSTDKGLVRFDVHYESVIVFNSGDGLPTNEFDSGAYFKAEDGAMYFGSINGVVYFYPEQVERDYSFPPVTLPGFKLFNKPVKIENSEDAILKKSITETREIVLSHDQNVFTIEFAMLHFRNPKQHKYQYRMAGLDEDWIDLGNKGEVTFSHIPPGKYEFQVRGCNSDEVWRDEESSLMIYIVPPIWGRLYFQILVGFSFLLLLLAYHKLRTRSVKRHNKQLLNLNELLNREVEDRKKAQAAITASLEEKEILLKEIHHRVKNNLQVTSSLLYLQSKNIRDKKAKSYLEESQNRIKSMAMIHEKLYRSENFAHINSRDYIRDLATYVFRSYSANGRKIKLTIHVDPIEFDLDTAIPCGLILNELVSNAIKYAFPGNKKGEIIISLKEIQDDQVALSVKDNGIGIPEDFDPENSASLGLQLVNSLVRQLEGTVEFKNNGGLEVIVVFRKPGFKNKKGFA